MRSSECFFRKMLSIMSQQSAPPVIIRHVCKLVRYNQAAIHRGAFVVPVLPQSDAAAATSKAEATAALEATVSEQRDKMKAELERAILTAERNALLQGLVMSESERRKKVRRHCCCCSCP